MSICKNNPNKKFIGNEPSPKGLGFCASGEKEGTKMKGKDGNIWIKKNNKWVKYINLKKIYKWWLKISTSGIYIIYRNNEWEFINIPNKKKLIEKWIEYSNDNNIKAILTSPMSIDFFECFTNYLIKNNSKIKLEKNLNMINYILSNYKLFFKKNYIYSKKDYILKCS